MRTPPTKFFSSGYIKDFTDRNGNKITLLAEFAGVLRGNRFRHYLPLEEVDEYVGEVEELCRMIADPEPVPAVLRGPL